MKLSHSLSILSRRKWIKLFLLGAVARAATGRQSLLAEIVPSSNSALLPIHLSQFPELNETGGSIALYFSNFRLPLIVIRGEGSEFYAMDSTCTHAGCQVDNYSLYYTPEYSAMECYCHGSLFDIQGRVVQGPAESDLRSFKTYFDGGEVVQVELTGVPLRIDSVTIQQQTVANTRLRLQFPGVGGCKYKVAYYSDLAAEPQPALFATSAAGNANESFLAVPFEGDGTKTIWVDAPGTQGFFAIEMVLSTFIPL